MGNIGWFILSYIVIGWAIDLMIMLGIKIYFGVKDRKKDDESYWLMEKGYIDALANRDEELETTSQNSKKMIFLGFILGRLLWPISIPMGYIAILQNIRRHRK